MRRLGWAHLYLLLATLPAFGQDVPRPASAVTLGSPVTLGAPIAATPRQPVIRAQSADDGFRVSSWASSLTESQGNGVASLTPLRVPEAATPAVGTSYSASQSDGYPATNYVPPPPPRPRVTAPDSRAGDTRKSFFGEFFDGWFQQSEDGRGCLESDHCFVTFISPVTNPFIAEDPRSLTEVRPIFMYQRIPDSNWVYKGGHVLFYGLQGRLALTEHWSIVLNKIGGITIDPGNDSTVTSQSGLTEVWVGPKWTFLRNTDTGTLAAAGATLQIPVGSGKAFQDTGTLSVFPYITFGQNFGRSSIGSFNLITTSGYNIRTDNTRSEYFANSFHLDYDVGNLHKFFPLVELNWFYYTRSGKNVPLAFEGADLVNYGSTDVNGRNNLTIAPGMRYRFNDHIEAGGAVEFPLVGTKDLNAFRMTFDLVFRY